MRIDSKREKLANRGSSPFYLVVDADKDSGICLPTVNKFNQVV